jgi:glutamate carboxypeptidase
MTSRIIPVAFFIFTAFTTLGQSKTEQKILTSVDKHHSEAVTLLKEVVNINSGTMNFDGVKKVGMIFKAKLDALGFETRWIDGTPFQRSGHLMAFHQGKKGPRFLLIGHLDTVFEPDSPFQQYTMLNDSIMKGPGVSDMKGGDVIILHTIQALAEAGVLNDMTIEVIMTGDEEKSGPTELSRKDLFAAAKEADIAFGFEDADNNPKTIVVSRRGSTSWELKVKGEPSHSSQVFTEKVGAGAVYETSRILMDFYTKLASEKDLTFNPGVILGGTSVDYDGEKSGGTAFGKTNVVAQTTVVRGDLRAVSQEQLVRAEARMKEIVANHLPKTSAEIQFSEGMPPLAPSEGSAKLLEAYSKTSVDLGYGAVSPVLPRNAGAADISYTAGLATMSIDGLGLKGGGDAHTVSETGNINLLKIQSKRTAILMFRLSQDKNLIPTLKTSLGKSK